MPALPNARHERFAQARAKGKSADDAYKAAGYRAHSGNAARLSGIESVRSRVAELQDKGAEKVLVTVETLSAELEEVRLAAIKEKQFSAAVSATMGKAKLHGKLIERKHLTGQVGVYDLTKVPDDQLDELEAILGPLADAGGDQGGESPTQH